MKVLIAVMRRALLVGAGALWLSGVAFGVTYLLRFENAPAPSTPGPGRWPAQTRLERDPARPNLVMLLHPHCPCSRASVAELNRILARARGRLRAHVVLLQPAGFDEDWAKTDVWRAAHALPGVAVVLDPGGRECARFRGHASGHTLLFDPAGQLVFEGGITPARGHQGDTAAAGAILAVADGKQAPIAQAPTFGCALQEVVRDPQ